MERGSTENQFETSINSLNGYNWNKVMNFLKESDPRFPVGRALFKDDYSEIRPHAEIVQNVENGLKNKNLLLLIGAKRIGTTSVGKSWVDKKPKKREMEQALLWTQADYDNNLEAVPEEEIFVDEFTGTKDEMYELVENLVKKQDKKLVLRIFSHVADQIEEKLTEKWLDFEEVEVLPLPKDKMREYVGHKLGLESNDPLVVVTTDMAGGSLLIAHSVCANLTNHAKWASEEMNPEEFRKILRTSYKEIGKMTMTDWMEDKKDTTDKFKKDYPSPLLQEFSSEIML